uniref:MHC class I-like antigen recognition-like domain-containing protein n=1 Tax=Anas platyrhynchos platyrhynchos TaxID=8840 RepID=U3I7A4_ANAPP
MRPGRAGALGQCPGPGLLLLLLGVLGGAASGECEWGRSLPAPGPPGLSSSPLPSRPLSSLLGPHSLRYFYTAVSDQSPGVPQFLTVGSVDGEVFVRYDSETRKMEPRVDWIVANTDQQYWDRETEISQSNEKFFRANLDTLRERYNQNCFSQIRGSSRIQSPSG